MSTPPAPAAPRTSSQFGLLGTRRLAPLFVTQFLGAFNDNVFRQGLLLVFVYGGLVAEASAGTFASLAAGLFILPFFLFSATAGALADRFEKARLIRFVKLGEIGVAVLAGFALYAQNVVALLAVLFLLGTQSAFFGPLKYAILPQHLAAQELVGGNAMVQMGTFTAILLGGMLGGFIGAGSATQVDVSGAGEIAPGATAWLFALVVAIAVCGYLASRWIPPALPARHDAGGAGIAAQGNPDWNPVTATWALIRLAQERKAVFLSVLGVSWFWLLGMVVLTQIPVLVRDHLVGVGEVVLLMLALFTVATAAGSLLCERLSRRRVEIGLVPLGAAGVSAFGVDGYFAIEAMSAAVGDVPPRTVLAFLAGPGTLRLLLDLFLMGTFAGFFVVPLQANIQARTPMDRRARVIAANNVLNALFMVAGSVFTIAWLELLGGSVPALFLALAIINVGVALFIFGQVPEFAMRFLVWALSHTMYRVRHEGLDVIPERGAAVIVCNHVSYVDAPLLAGAVRRPIRFVMHQDIYALPVLRFIFRTGRAIPIAAQKDAPEVFEAAFDDIREALAAGDLLCIFPEGRLTPDGEIGAFRKGIERILAETPVPVVPVALRGLWGSYFSHEGRGAFRPGSGRWWSPVDVVAGEPVHAGEAALAGESAASYVSADELRERVLALRGEAR